ncbi:MAG: ATPase [Planctomycetes bacterium GWF2_42_9]|nr:MAG: ATPase [Planctomycetes bacterium GWF2_42_9]
MYYTRAIKDSWMSASEQFPVLLLTGPRQVGKTTFLQHICGKERQYLSLDDPSLRLLANDDPALFFQRFAPPLLIDEIQYAPGLLPHIKMIVDKQKQPGLFWLTGSQQFLMMKGISETLAGRVAIMNLLGFSNRERHKLNLNVEPFFPVAKAIITREKNSASSNLKDVYKDIWLGSFPSLIAGTVTNRDLFYSSYLQTYLQRDVKDLAQVGNERSFIRFIKACAARTGQMLNYAELARDTDISLNTSKHWLSILQASFQVVLLQPYYSNVTKRLIKTPKLYFLDTGLCAYLTEWATAATLESGAMAGAILETYVLTEILKSWWYKGKFPQLYYYRDKDGREIDVVFEQDMTLYPLEIKRSASPKPQWTENFRALSNLKLPVGEGGVICLCPQSLPLRDNVTAIPIGCI